jgi:hypothetical protein
MTVPMLPNAPTYSEATPYLWSNANDMESPAGGVTQRVLRLGTRFGLDVTYPSMSYAQAQAFLAVMIPGEGTPVGIVFPQRGIQNTAGPGFPVVNGAAQSGTTLAIRGATVGYTVQQGQFFHFVTGGRRFLHMITAGLAVAGTGHASLPIWPMMRVSPADGDTVELVNPVMEGFIALKSRKNAWTLAMVRRLGFSVSITEDR